MEYLSQFAAEFIFFSGDVQTTTIAVAVTGSICYSVVCVIIHLFVRLKRIEKGAIGAKPRKISIADRKPSVELEKCEHGSIYEGFIKSLLGRKTVFHPVCLRCGKRKTNTCCYFMNRSSHISKFSFSSDRDTSSDICSILQQKPTELNLSYCKIEKWPDRLGFVGAQLTFLNLSSNNLSFLPVDLGCLRGLQHLYVHSNNLDSIPNTIQALSSLTVLDFADNNLHELPECLCCLNELTYIDVSYNKIKYLPEKIGCLKNVQEFYAESNCLKSLPESFFDLRKLEHLNLNKNPVKTLEYALGNFTMLVNLAIADCEIEHLPSTLGCCTALKSIKLDKNRLQTIPGEIGQLHSLELLLLSENNLKCLPASILYLRLKYIDGNPLLEQVEIDKEMTAIDCDIVPFPSLLEICMRCTVKQNLSCQHIPSTLKERMKVLKTCSVCGARVFNIYLTKYSIKPFTMHSSYPPVVTVLPIKAVFCSQQCLQVSVSNEW